MIEGVITATANIEAIIEMSQVLSGRHINLGQSFQPQPGMTEEQMLNAPCTMH
jgi:hypothetical protein